MENLLTTDACTMPTAERPLRLAEFDALFAGSVRGVERDGDSLRLQLRGAGGLSDKVRDLAERESICCSFFTFTVTGPDEDLRLDITVPSEQRDILAALGDRASELSR